MLYVIPLLLLAALAVPLVLWARWVGKRLHIPRAWRVAPVIVVVIALLGVGYVAYGLIASFAVVDGESIDPSQKARILAEGISEVFNCFAFAFLALVLAAHVLLAATWRWHWGAKRSGGRS